MEEQSVHSSISDINSEETVKTEPARIPRKKRICLVGPTCDDAALGAAAQQFSVPVLKSNCGSEYIEDTTYCTYFILNQFEGPEYDALHKSAHRILGPTALLQLAEKKESLPSISRPLYTQAMLGTVVVFTGFRKKDELTKLINMIHSMGGSIRKEMGVKVTHLIANCCGGEKYKYAVTFRVPIMSMNWVTALWDRKYDTKSFGNNEELVANFKLKPFVGAKVCFFGFPEDEKKHMCEVLQQQGGEPTEIDDPNCTHVVTDMGNRRCRIADTQTNKFSYFKRTSGESRLATFNFLRKEPFSFTFYNPYTNTIPRSLNTWDSLSGLSNTMIRRKRGERSISMYEMPSWSGGCIMNKDNSRGNLMANNLSEDSAIMIDWNSSGGGTLPENLETMSGNSTRNESEMDSGIDSSMSTAMSCEMFNSSEKILARSGTIARKQNNSEFIQDEESREMEMDIDAFVPQATSADAYKTSETIALSNNWGNEFSTILPHWQPLKCSSAPAELGSKCFKFQSDTHNRSVISSSSHKKIIIPRRYVRWRKSKSCFAIPKITTPDHSKFVKTHSHPNLEKKHDSFVSDQFINDSPPLCRKSNYSSSTLKLATNLLAKMSEINFPHTFKQSMQVSPARKGLEKIPPRQKYTPLPSPLPARAKIPRIANRDVSKISSNSSLVEGSFEDFSQSCVKLRTLNRGENVRPKRFEDKPRLAVVDESNVNALPDLASVRAHIVKAEWFWTSVQNEGAADEKEYLFEDYLESVLSPTASARRDSQQAATPTTASTRRKRKRLAETLSSLVQNGADSPAVHKRRSSISDAGHLSVSGSFLDCTTSPDKLLDEVEAVTTETSRKNLSPRHQVFLELVQTESNYVGILSTIMTLFKSPLEDLIETSGELLNTTEVKKIFGDFPPIYEVHKKMLEELRYSAAHWAEDVSIGNIFLKYAPDLVKAYPPYVNFFENIKEMLDQCDQNKPRFHAFLKICQTKPECGRQSLKELLIKPVQRLPSISLLLNDILKHTNKNNPDHSALELSISSIKEVMTYINEDKRKTEGQVVIFDIFNEIDNCPPYLVSSHRSFIGKCDVMELSESLSGRGDHLVLFLFNDTLEICKKRSKAFNSLKSPNTANGLHSAKLSQGKPYKHIAMLSLSTIKKVVDIRETDECQKVFALMVRSNQEFKEKLFSFTITDEEVNKTNYLRTLCRQMANTVCKTDADTFLISLDSHQLEIDTSDVALGTLSKAFKSLFHNFYLEYMDPYVFLLNSMCETTLHVPLPFASRTRMKVGRAFSFNKTPSKLKRAMSTMMSPFGSTNSLTPASQQLAQMRLASCNNINELGNGGSGSPSRDEVLVAPMSVQPTRKAKCSSLSMAPLRRNCSEEVVQDKGKL
ncbi:protein ECT2 isoform X3 [Venturia canescens]|uniref:protein ECT2 isoform X3 n=1 Tax=Venturia canescens TaxID=32260 RepID=UPI001C9C2636|nr:protein ECT2 isoform X3 [Venturia canescens]